MSNDVCGTMPGYFRHRSRGQETCRPCRDAMAEYVRKNRKRYRYNCADCGIESESTQKDAKRCKSCARRLSACGGDSARAKQLAAAVKLCPVCCATVRGRKYCSDECRAKNRPPEVPCLWCGGPKEARHRTTCSDECASWVTEEFVQAGKSSLRLAYESGDKHGFYAALAERSDVDGDTGCWRWSRSNARGYPITQFQGERVAVHRLVLEVKCGAPLGKQAAHHMCGNSMCVNPDHLQPVTAAENSAEMLARTYLESRISDLEAALSEVCPDHPLLSEVSVVSAS